MCIRRFKGQLSYDFLKNCLKPVTGSESESWAMGFAPLYHIHGITQPNKKSYRNRKWLVYRQRRCLEAWHINSTHGLFPEAYLHFFN